MVRTAQISKVKQHSITLRHEGQSLQNFSRTLNIYSSAVAKTIKCMNTLALMRTVTGKEDPELSLMNLSSAAELPASEIAAQINAQNSSKRHISTSSVQRRPHESGLHDRIAGKKPLLKDTNKMKRLAWAKKQKQWTLDQLKSVLWSDESKCEIFVRRRVGERMISACVVPTVKHVGGGVMVHCW